jgi:hypothetical protein
VRGQLPTEALTIINLTDGEFKSGRAPVKYAFKVNNENKAKWYVVCHVCVIAEQEEFVIKQSLYVNISKFDNRLNLPD